MADPTPGDLSARLPELPEPQRECWIGHTLYTADQMRAYAIAALSALPAGGGVWRPIASVPRDGTRVVVWMPDGTFSSASYSAHSEPQGVYWMIPTTPQPSAADTISTLVRLARHADDCLYVTPLPTGEGFWHCTCGYDSIILDGELYPMPRNLLAAPAAGKGVDDANEREAFEKWARPRWSHHPEAFANVPGRPEPEYNHNGVQAAWAGWQAALTRQPVAGDGK